MSRFPEPRLDRDHVADDERRPAEPARGRAPRGPRARRRGRGRTGSRRWGRRARTRALGPVPGSSNTSQAIPCSSRPRDPGPGRLAHPLERLADEPLLARGPRRRPRRRRRSWSCQPSSRVPRRAARGRPGSAGWPAADPTRARGRALPDGGDDDPWRRRRPALGAGGADRVADGLGVRAACRRRPARRRRSWRPRGPRPPRPSRPRRRAARAGCPRARRSTSAACGRRRRSAPGSARARRRAAGRRPRPGTPGRRAPR